MEGSKTITEVVNAWFYAFVKINRTVHHKCFNAQTQKKQPRFQGSKDTMQMGWNKFGINVGYNYTEKGNKEAGLKATLEKGILTGNCKQKDKTTST